MKEEKKYVVYTIEYQGKIMYVGCTGRFAGRKKNHERQGKNSAIPDDIDPEECTIQVVYETDDREETYRVEGDLINEYDTIKEGWNVHRSGLVTKNPNYHHNHYLETKDLHYEWNKQYRETHKEEVAEYHHNYYQKWYEDHKEEKMEYNRQYYYNNLEKRKAYDKQYRETHKEQISKKNHKYYLATKDTKVVDKEKKKAYMEEYYQKNKEKIKKQVMDRYYENKNKELKEPKI